MDVLQNKTRLIDRRRLLNLSSTVVAGLTVPATLAFAASHEKEAREKEIEVPRRKT
jgi:hypothetical protein